MRVVDASEAQLKRKAALLARIGVTRTKKEAPVPGTDGVATMRKKWETKLMHPTYQLVADICPMCGFPEAEGGYCAECGWSLPHPFKN